MITLAARNLTLRREAKTILDDVSLNAAHGDFIAVIGANGAGKSSLLAALAGLWRPTRGQIELDGQDVYKIASKTLARRRAYLPQNPRCDWPLSVERLVALGLTPILPALGNLPPQQLQRIDEVLQLCDLTEHRSQPVTTLSGGELTRAMLGRALVGSPELLIVDEPIAGLDPRHAVDTMRRLCAYARTGKLVIAAIHDLTLAARYATRVFALASGKVTGDGSTDSTLTTELIRETFDIEARISGESEHRYVNYLSARAPPAPPIGQ
jgi:iron complex transport system ATP-binding protein